MMTTYRQPAERSNEAPRWPSTLYDYDAAWKRKRRAATIRLTVVFALWSPLLVYSCAETPHEELTRRILHYSIIGLVVVVIGVVYAFLQPRFERRSFYRRELARRTDEFLREEEERQVRTRVFLRPIASEATAPEYGAERSEGADDACHAPSSSEDAGHARPARPSRQ